MFQSHLTISNDNQALAPMSCKAGIREVQINQQILNILENIEPEIVYSGYDNSQSDAPHLLLTSLNRLCEKQLLWIVKWSKSLPGNGSLQLRVTKVVAMGIPWQTLLKVSALNLTQTEGNTLPCILAMRDVGHSIIKQSTATWSVKVKRRFCSIKSKS